MDLLKIIRKLIKGEEPKSQEEKFFELAEKYGIYGKVTVHHILHEGYTLYPVVKNKEEKPVILPGRFIEEFLDLLYEGINRKKHRLAFSISFEPRVFAEIQEAQRTWNAYCAMVNE
jgi:hypothetical protein